MAVLLAVASASLLGTGDFLSGLVGRRVRLPGISTTVAWSASVVGALVAWLVLAVAPPGELTATDVGWAVVAGFGVAAVRPLLYLGMARGPIVIFAPTFSLVALIVPAIVGPLVGQGLSLLEVGGVLLALPAVVFVSSSPRPPRPSELLGSPAVVLGCVVGGLIGAISLCFSFISTDAGVMPAAVTQSMAALLIPVVLLVGQPLPRPDRPVLGWSALIGFVDILAIFASVLAFQRGSAAVVSAVLGLAPAVAIVLARTVLDEPIVRIQLVGAALGAVAIALFAAGG
ncbi:MAG: DMT family transporter [Actinomycetota bacterium]